jgi:hypothetical protein
VKPATKPTHFVPVVFMFRAVSGADEANNAARSAEVQRLDPTNNAVTVSSGTSDKTIA